MGFQFPWVILLDVGEGAGNSVQEIKWIPVLTLLESSCDSPVLTLPASVPGHILSLNLMKFHELEAGKREPFLLFGSQSSLPPSFNVQDMVHKWNFSSHFLCLLGRKAQSPTINAKAVMPHKTV